MICGSRLLKTNAVEKWQIDAHGFGRKATLTLAEFMQLNLGIVVNSYLHQNSPNLLVARDGMTKHEDLKISD